MIFNSLFFQIVLAGLAVGIAVIYVQPAFTNIGVLQDAIVKYTTEREQVIEVNATLATLARKVGNISEEDQSALLIYMPDDVDTIAVSRDIYNISLLSGVNITSIDKKEVDNTPERKAEDGHHTPAVPHTFSVTADGSYGEIKNFLRLLEQSNYPLEVHNLNISNSSAEDNTLQTNIEIVTYSRI